MIRKQKLFLTLLFIIMGLFTAIQNSAADEWISEPNWWFKQEYTIDETALPENLFFITTRYEETALGELVFRNGGDTPVFLFCCSPIPTTEFRTGSRLNEEFIREHSILLKERQATTVRADKFLDNGFLNTNGEGEITQEPPPPYKTRMVMFLDRVVYVVPVTVTYSLNPDYLIDPNPPIPTPTIAEYADSVPFIVDGVVHAPLDIDPQSWDGAYEVTVHRWFKGEGAANIQVYFKPFIDADSLWNPPSGKRIILYLRRPVDENFPYRYFGYEMLNEPAVSELIAAIGHEPFTPPALEVVATTVENTAVSKPTNLWLGLGVAGLALAAVVAFFLIRRRRRLA